MTEKQFYIDTIDGGGSVLTANGVELGLYETCDLLNELYEEKEQLAKENKELQQKNKEWIKYVHQLEIALKKKGV